MFLLRQDIADAMIHARATGLQPPASVLEEFRHLQASSSRNGEPRIFKRAGDVAEIHIEGVLSPKMDIWALWYGEGCTVYGDIIQSLALASADPSIRRVVLNVASPGGYVAGLFDCLAALEMFSKPKDVIASMADSAAYAIAALGGKITAVNPAAEFGSVGVVQTHVKYDFAEVINITSTHAPDKRPDPGTEDGQKVIRKHLDDLHDLFVDAIARGRGKTKDVVNQTFGRGAVILAKEAKSLGMIDKIVKQHGSSLAPDPGLDDAGGSGGASAAAAASAPQPAPPAQPSPPAVTATTPAASDTNPSASAVPAAPAQPQNASAGTGGAQQTRQKMTEAELRAQHPEIFTALDKKHEEAVKAGKTEGEKVGAERERKRCVDHLKLGKACGDVGIAHKAIGDGTDVADMQADYLAARMNSAAIGDRQKETDEAGAAADGAKKDAPKKDASEEVADLVADIMDGKVKL